jgi:GxxExxY protein
MGRTERVPFKVTHEQTKLRLTGEYVADILVETTILIEVRAVRQLNENHLAQCLNYLKATGLNACLLFIRE